MRSVDLSFEDSGLNTYGLSVVLQTREDLTELSESSLGSDVVFATDRSKDSMVGNVPFGDLDVRELDPGVFGSENGVVEEVDGRLSVFRAVETREHIMS